jgi:hypothetical protein
MRGLDMQLRMGYGRTAKGDWEEMFGKRRLGEAGGSTKTIYWRAFLPIPLEAKWPYE